MKTTEESLSLCNKAISGLEVSFWRDFQVISGVLKHFGTIDLHTILGSDENYLSDHLEPRSQLHKRGVRLKLGCDVNLGLFIFIDEVLSKTKFKLCFDGCSCDLKIGKVYDGD